MRNPGRTPEEANSRFQQRSAQHRRRRGDRKAGRGAGRRPAPAAVRKVLDDVIDGYVSRGAALADYGADETRLDAAR